MQITNLLEALGARKSKWNDLFSSDNGKYILKALYNFCNIDGSGVKCEDIKISQGRRDVFNYILSQTQFDVQEYVKLYKETKDDKRRN